MSENNEVTIERDIRDDHAEDGVVVPLDRINPDTLRKMVEEFVTRDWSELADANCTFEDKVEQVIQQLKEKRIKVVFDLTSGTCNIVSADNLKHHVVESEKV
jgi:hypothetical protein